jgi:hypothetical protein
MLSGRKKKDYAAESAVDALEATGDETAGVDAAETPAIPADEPIPEELAA